MTDNKSANSKNANNKNNEYVPSYIDEIIEEETSQRKKRLPGMSISTRLFLYIMTMVLIFIATIIFVDTRLLNVAHIFSTAWQLWELGDEVNALYQTDGDFLQGLSDLENKYSISLEIYDANDHLVYSSDSNPDHYGEDTDQSLIRHYELIASSDIGVNRHFEIQRDLASSFQMEYIVYVSTLENNYTVKAYKMKSPVDEGVQMAIQTVAFTAIGIIFISAIIIRLFSVRFTNPLKEISAVTQKMAQLDFSKRCPPSRTKEIAVLSNSVNVMSESLQATLEDLREKNKKLQDDYEKEKTLEHLRFDFITGASHELKTPIAIIQGYAEGLTYFVDSDPETAKQYAETIVGETKRMNDLVLRLLEIIRYDSGDYIINRAVFDVHDLVQEWFTREENILAEKQIRYMNTIPQGLMGSGDAMLLGVAVSNYLSNGVSHIGGERLLKTWCTDTGTAYRISVFNTGDPIADKDIDKIWSSFYRADKSMSRKEGRFGLGLAAVSSIQHLHGQAFGVENMEGGVRFWFDIEKASEEEIEQAKKNYGIKAVGGTYCGS